MGRIACQIKYFALFIFAVSVILPSNFSFGATIHVPADYSTIQAGIDAASDGYIVLVADGEYVGSGNANLDFKGKAITVQSQNGPTNCIIRLWNNWRGFYFHSGETQDSILSGFTITDGYEDSGAGIFIYRSSPTISNCVITKNKSTMYPGGGIRLKDSSAKIINCTISENEASTVAGFPSGGGIAIEDSSPTIIGCTVSGNMAMPGDGGGIFIKGNSSVTITDSTINDNHAGYGGGISSGASSLTIKNCIISGNKARKGGGIISSNPSTVINGCTISGNTASDYPTGEGGGIYFVIILL